MYNLLDLERSSASAAETLTPGEGTGTPVSEDYKVPFKFTGDIEEVVIEL